MGRETVYISTDHIGLYEKYGYDFFKTAKSVGGEETRIYRKKLSADGDEKQKRMENGGLEYKICGKAIQKICDSYRILQEWKEKFKELRAGLKNKAAEKEGGTDKKMTVQEQFNLIAKEYDENRRKFIPCFDDYYISSTDFAAKSLEKTPNLIFDLGSGTGLLLSFWFRHFSDVKYVLVDLAEEMLAVAKKRFENLLNVEYKILDYSKELPAGNPDLVISALSIHHLEHDAKQNLFKKIYSALSENGAFINYDQFCAEDAAMNKKIEKYWTEQIKSSNLSEKEFERWQERKKLDRECSVRQEIEWLKQAGFKSADGGSYCTKWVSVSALMGRRLVQ